MKILQVFHAGSTGPQKTVYDNLVGAKNFPGFKESLIDKEVAQDIVQRGGYFVSVLRNRKPSSVDFLDTQYNIEEDLASNFLGRHWYRAFTSPVIGDTPQISPNGQYYGALSTNVKDVSFANFAHKPNSNVGKITASFGKRQLNDFRQFGRLKYAFGQVPNNDEFQPTLVVGKKIVRSMIYLNKDTSEAWNPLRNTNTSLNALEENAAELMFKKIELPVSLVQTFTVDENLAAQVSETQEKFVELYVFFPGSLDISAAAKISPYEENPIKIEGQEPFLLATGGLLSKRVIVYTVQGIPVYTPAGSSVLYEDYEVFEWKRRLPDTAEYSRPSYKVFVTSSLDNRGRVAKAESVYVNPANITGTLKTEYRLEELARDSLKFVNRLNEACNVAASELEAAHVKLSKNLNYSVAQPFTTKTFNLYGVTIPASINIKSGLQKVSVRVSDAGVTTEIVLGDSLFTPPSKNIIRKQIELDARALNARRNPL